LIESADPFVVSARRTLPLGWDDLIGLEKPAIERHLREKDQVAALLFDVLDKPFPGLGEMV
jgi:hypothetical protein